MWIGIIIVSRLWCVEAITGELENAGKQTDCIVWAILSGCSNTWHCLLCLKYFALNISSIFMTISVLKSVKLNTQTNKLTNKCESCIHVYVLFVPPFFLKKSINIFINHMFRPLPNYFIFLCLFNTQALRSPEYLRLFLTKRTHSSLHF